MNYATLAFLVLAACGQQQQKLPEERSNVEVTAPRVEHPKPPPKPFSYDEKSELIDFHFGWSAEAAAVPQLVKRFEGDLQKAKAKLLAGAREDKAFREKEGYDFNGHMSSTDYETAGQSTKLLSLRANVGDYTGGAHGNRGTSGLLWDRNMNREIEVANLFAERSNMDRLLTQRWCNGLNAERQQRRGELTEGGMFDDCPAFDQVAVIPSDGNRNGRFDRLLIIASPYVAGPYAEGEYEIDLGVTSDLIAAFREEYRSQFEIAQTQ